MFPVDMSSLLPLICLLLLAEAATALRFPVGKAVAAQGCSDSSCTFVSEIDNQYYYTNITIGGERESCLELTSFPTLTIPFVHLVFPAFIDTSTPDLLVNSSFQSVPGAQVIRHAIATLNFQSSLVTGPVGFSHVEFENYSVPNQAYLNAVVAANDVLGGIGLHAVLGLGPTNKSAIRPSLQKYNSSGILGKSLLHHIFEANPSQPNITTLMAPRIGDSNTTAASAGFLTIGEIEPGFEAINAQKSIPWLDGSSSWSFNVDEIVIGNQPAPTTSGINSVDISTTTWTVNFQAFFDTEVPGIEIGPQVAENIYNNTPGAFRLPRDNSIWVVPCDFIPPQVIINIGGASYPIHPLDTSSVVATYKNASGVELSVCYGTCYAHGDLAFGVGVLPSWYTL